MMTEFVQAGGDTCLLVPAGLVDAGRLARLAQRERVERSGAQIAGLDEAEVVATLTAARRARAQADAAEAHALARLDELRGGDRYVADEAALELRVSRHTAQNRLGRAQALTERMPHLLGMLESGEIEGALAGRVRDITAVLDDEHARDCDEQLGAKVSAGRVGLSDPAGLTRAARRLVEKIDPHGQAERARRARADRRVELVPGEHAVSTLSGDLPAEVAGAAYSRIDALARKLREQDTRTLDQLRADVYADLLLGRDPGATVPAVAASVFVHLPADAALTMSDSGCELSGYGPIPGPVAREIMTNPDSAWRRVLTDPATGMPHNLGRYRRKPSALIRDLVAVRDRECSAPGCHRPAQRSDFDHMDEWADGGATAVINGDAKCERDHYRKDARGWIYIHDPATATMTVATPAGYTYSKVRDTIIKPAPPLRSTPDVARDGPALPDDDAPPF